MKRNQPLVLPLILALLLTGPVLQAGEITGFTWFSGVASVAGEPVSPPAVPNNDDHGPGVSPNPIIVTQKDYVGIGPVDLVFDVRDTGGTTEYAVYEGVQNSTGVDWNAYHIELGFGVGDDFVKSAPGDGLDFDAPLFNSDVDMAPLGGVLPWPTVTVTEDDLYATGSQPAFTWSGMFVFHVDVPDGIDRFTIRQSPIGVPEPTALATLALGALAAVRRRPM